MEKRKKPKKEQKMSIKGIGKAENKANESIEDIWPDYPSKDDFFFDEEEY